MENKKRRQELAQFLRTRRERLSPEAVGLATRSRRRTPGLRREELSQLVGIGVTWYTRLEQGQDIVVSSQVLESLARVLELSAAERNHLFVLARELVPAEAYPLTSMISPQLQCILDAITTCPAYVINPRLDILGWNRVMVRLFSYADTSSLSERNILRAMFTDPSQRTVLYKWEKEARETLALFRANADRYIQEPWFKALVTELQSVSSEFREWWLQHDIQSVYTGQKELNHPQFGRVALQSNLFQVIDAPDLRMVVFTAAEVETEKKLTQLTELMEV